MEKPMIHVLKSALIGLAVTLGGTAALAHATLETQQAAIKTNYKAVMRTPHGCEGTATLKVRIQIPEGVIAVKPQPKAGWTLEIVKAKYAKSYDYYGTPMTEGVKEIIWSGKLLDENYDEFVFRAYLTDSLKPGEMLYFPTIQECEKGTHRWIEIPAEGKKGRRL
jgi:periplasmic copper chaperone A